MVHTGHYSTISKQNSRHFSHHLEGLQEHTPMEATFRGRRGSRDQSSQSSPIQDHKLH